MKTQRSSSSVSHVFSHVHWHLALCFFRQCKKGGEIRKKIRNTKRIKFVRRYFVCAGCNKLLNSQKSTIKIVSIISCQQAIKEPLLKPSFKLSKRMSSKKNKNEKNEKIFADLQLRQLCVCARMKKRVCFSSNGYDWAVSVVFCSLQSLKIHLMLPPYAINYHFCLTLFGSFCSGRSKQSRPQYFCSFAFLFLICHGRFFFHSFIYCGPLFAECMRWSPVDSLSQQTKSRSRQIVFGHCWISHRSQALISKFMTWLIFFFDFFSSISRNRSI